MNRNENEAESFAGNFMAFGEEALFFEVPIRQWCAPGHLGAAPCSAHPIQNFLPGTMVAIIGDVWAHGTPQGGGGNPNARLCVCGSRKL